MAAGSFAGLATWRYRQLSGGLATAALVPVVGGSLTLGLLAYLTHVDRSVASWASRHATAWSTHGLDVVTRLGASATIAVLGLVVVAVETRRTRSPWIAAFLVVLMVGEWGLTAATKDLVDRARPAFNAAAAALGPSFPSGHSANAAAFYAAAALLLGRGRSRTARALLAGLAAGIAVGVAASRVLLDLHWLSDVLAGLALGWAWFAVCVIAFSGRLVGASRWHHLSHGPPHDRRPAR